MTMTPKFFFDRIQNAEPSVFIFDLDSTLFNVSPRSHAIMHEFADLYHQDLKKIEILHTEWGLREPLERHGNRIEDHLELHKSLRDFWVEKFFSNSYLHYDIPYRGAVSFVQRLHQLQNKIYYLTGRDTKRMGIGTEEVLKKWGFPLQKDSIQLKPHRDLVDEDFKCDWIKKKMQKFPNKKIYFFENEPVNLNRVGADLPEVNLIYIDTTHSRKQSLSVKAITWEDFNLDNTRT